MPPFFSFLADPARLSGPLTLNPGLPLTNLLSCAQCAASGHSKPLRILAFGDSLVAGFGLSHSAGFTVQLEKTLKAEGFAVTVINAGIPGDTSEGGRRRLEQALQPPPDLLLLELGANDNLLGLPPAHLEANLEAIILRLQQNRIPVLLAGIEPLRDLGEAYRADFTAVFVRLATRHNLALYADFLAGVAGQPDLLKRDGIHPNPKGVKTIVRQLTPVIAEILRRLQTDSS